MSAIYLILPCFLSGIFVDINDTQVQDFLRIVENRTPFISFQGKYTLSKTYRSENKMQLYKVDYATEDNNIYIRYQKTAPDEDGLFQVMEGYFYNGSPAYMQYQLRETNEMFQSPSAFLKGAVDFGWPFAQDLSPRRVMGEVGGEAIGPIDSIHGIPLLEFLKREGKYWYEEIGAYRVLSHEAIIGRHRESRDIWIDHNDDIIKIENISRPWTATPEMLAKYNIQGFDEYFLLRCSVELDKYITTAENLRFPLLCTSRIYTGSSEAIQAYQSTPADTFEESQLQEIVMLHGKEELALETQVEFKVADCRFNVPIEDNVFEIQLPVGTVYSKESGGKILIVEEHPTWLYYLLQWMPIVIIVVTVIILLISGKHYFNWRW